MSGRDRDQVFQIKPTIPKQIGSPFLEELVTLQKIDAGGPRGPAAVKVSCALHPGPSVGAFK